MIGKEKEGNKIKTKKDKGEKKEVKRGKRNIERECILKQA